MKEKIKDLTISYKLLRKISDYYEFPFAVFLLSDVKKFKGTRKTSIHNDVRKLRDKLNKAIDEFLGGINERKD